MGWRVDNYEGEHVDVEKISVNELERIRGELMKEVESKVRLIPTRVLLDDVDMIDEELEARVGDQCTCQHYVVDYSDPERHHPENVDREPNPECPEHGGKP